MRSLIGAAHGRGGQLSPNLIANGSFVSHADGWYPASHFGSAVHAAAGGRSDNGGAISTMSEVVYQPGSALVALAGATSLVVDAYVKASEVDTTGRVSLRFFSDQMGAVRIGSDVLVPVANFEPLVAGSWTRLTASDLAVPDGATHVSARLIHTAAVDPALWDDIYVGLSGGNTPPYAAGAAVPLSGNRIFNGTFEANSLGWNGWWGTEVIARTTVSPIAGVGSLSVTTDGEGSEQGAFYGGPYAPGTVVIPGETVTFAFTIDGDGAGDVKAQVAATDGDPITVWTGTPTGTPTVVSEEVVIPGNVVMVLPLFITADETAITFRLDAVSLTATP